MLQQLSSYSGDLQSPNIYVADCTNKFANPCCAKLLQAMPNKPALTDDHHEEQHGGTALAILISFFSGVCGRGRLISIHSLMEYSPS